MSAHHLPPATGRWFNATVTRRRSLAGLFTRLWTLTLLCGCGALDIAHRDVHFGPVHGLSNVAAPCELSLPIPATTAATDGLDPSRIRLMTWNLHKNTDRGWDRDLDRFARAHDIVLLQEARANDALISILFDTGHRWSLGSAFRLAGHDTGVMTVASTGPLAGCSVRTQEPWLRIPKAAVITVFPLRGYTATLMVANIHAVNFTAGTHDYGEQLAAIERVLSRHSGPMVFAGDFNTWSEARHVALHGVLARLGLAAVRFEPDRRVRFLGEAVDHVFVRGLDVVRSEAQPVTSSDHHPLFVEMRVRGATAAAFR